MSDKMNDNVSSMTSNILIGADVVCDGLPEGVVSGL